jgi:hypothetical protein
VRPLVVVLVLSGAACTTPGRWVASPDPTLDDAYALMCAEDLAALQREVLASELPRIPTPKRMRPCCVLGGDVRVRLGPVPIPGFRMVNVIGVDDIGSHTYDSGLLRVGRKGEEPLAFNRERNGLVYTCRGGFIDTAHVRGYVDWALYLTATAGRYLLGVTSPRETASPRLPAGQDSKRLRIHTDTNDSFYVEYGNMLDLDGRPDLIRHNAKEGWFGLDDEVKHWVRRAIDLRDGSRKVVKLDFSQHRGRGIELAARLSWLAGFPDPDRRPLRGPGPGRRR